MKPAFLPLVCSLALISCGVLQPVADTSVHHLLNPAVPERAITGSSPSLAIARPALPGYLDRRQLVSLTGEGGIQMNTNQLWAEPLDSGIARVTAANLGRLTNSLNIQPVGNFITMDYQTLLELRIERFEPDAAGVVHLACTWKLQPVAGAVAPTRSFNTSVSIDTSGGPVTPTGPQTARIRAMDEALAQLARQIARSL